jgi:hypothetical protein
MSLINRIAKFARSPQGKKAIAEGKRLARDPKTRAKLEDARRRLATRAK